MLRDSPAVDVLTVVPQVRVSHWNSRNDRPRQPWQDSYAHRSKAHTAMLEKGGLASAGESGGASL